MRHPCNATRQCFTFLFFLLLFTACKQKAPPADASINPAFGQAPPEASDITVSVLDKPVDGGNTLLTARFDKKVVTGNFHAVMASDQKMVLRDDGNGGDEKAGDGVFSIVVNQDIDAFRKEISTIQQANKRLVAGKQNLFKFVNRSAVPIMESVNNFDAKSFSNERIMRIDADALFAAVPDPLLTDHSLMVNDLGVVQDATRTFNPCTNQGNINGAWTFGKLIANMANTPVTGVSFESFVREWLKKWIVVQVVNGDIVNPRQAIFDNVIKPWLIKSNPGVPPANITSLNWTTFTIKPESAPFRLLAIVNRLDLRGNSGYSLSNAGEGRFVFGLENINANCTPFANPGKFTVIFEYGIPKKTCASLKAYAQAWVNLKNLTLGSAAYNNALQVITDQFTAAGAGDTRPNGSSINQVRTNEAGLGILPWELREFTLNAGTHLLQENTVAQEPAIKYNSQAAPPATPANLTILADYVNNNQPHILANAFTIPLTLTTSSGTVVNFRGAKAHTETPNLFWNGSATPGPGFINNDQARHILSINTCDGCHGGEGKTSGLGRAAFLHIDPQPFGVKAGLSAFLTGDPAGPGGFFEVTDPAGRPAGAPTVRKFNDLARRNIDLQVLATMTCKTQLLDLIHVLKFKPVNMPH